MKVKKKLNFHFNKSKKKIAEKFVYLKFSCKFVKQIKTKKKYTL